MFFSIRYIVLLVGIIVFKKEKVSASKSFYINQVDLSIFFKIMENFMVIKATFGYPKMLRN